MKIAAVIPVFNRPDVALEALESVFAQTRKADRVIVVDDGSTDDTVVRLEAWRAERSANRRFEIIRQRNMGPGEARNTGARAAEDCELLALLDSDDLWPADYLARMEKAMEDRPEASVAIAARHSKDYLAGRETLRRYDEPGRLEPGRIFVQGPAGTSNSVIRMICFHKIGGFEAGRRCAEDYQLYLRLSLCGPFVVVAGEPVVTRRGTAGKKAGEKVQWSRAYNDRRWHIAKMMEQFIKEDGGGKLIAAEIWKPRLGRMWYAAGRGLRKMGRKEDAKASFRKCVTYYPTHVRARWRLIWG